MKKLIDRFSGLVNGVLTGFDRIFRRDDFLEQILTYFKKLDLIF